MINPQRCLHGDTPRSQLEWIIFSYCATTAGDKAAVFVSGVNIFFILRLLPFHLFLLLRPNYIFPLLKRRKSRVWVAALKKKREAFKPFFFEHQTACLRICCMQAEERLAPVEAAGVR